MQFVGGNYGFNKDAGANSSKAGEDVINSGNRARKIDGYYKLEAERPYFIRTVKDHYKSVVVRLLCNGLWLKINLS